MKTAVEILIQELHDNGYFHEGVPENLVQQAKEMEKEQMIEFAKEVFICRYNGIQERLSNIANDIYKETYGGCEQ
jgi:broad-specificity NMP kinase